MCIRNRNRPMSNTLTAPPLIPLKRSGTRILIDLQRELTPEELDRFVASAKAAGAPTLTDHFLNLTLRLRDGFQTEVAP